MTQLHLSEKQWTAIVAVGWVLVFVNASFARSITSEFFGEGRTLEHIEQVRTADPAGPLFVAVPRAFGHQTHEGVHGHVWPVALNRPVPVVSAATSAF